MKISTIKNKRPANVLPWPRYGSKINMLCETDHMLTFKHIIRFYWEFKVCDLLSVILRRTTTQPNSYHESLVQQVALGTTPLLKRSQRCQRLRMEQNGSKARRQNFSRWDPASFNYETLLKLQDCSNFASFFFISIVIVFCLLKLHIYTVHPCNDIHTLEWDLSYTAQMYAHGNKPACFLQIWMKHWAAIYTGELAECWNVLKIIPPVI